MLLAWRNDPQTRAASLQNTLVTPQAHASWFERVLADADRSVLIGELSPGEPNSDNRIGMVRFDHAESRTEVSINVNPHFRGRGLGRELLRAALREHATRTASSMLTATIRVDNAASIRLFEGAGFVRASGDVSTSWYELVMPPVRSAE